MAFNLQLVLRGLLFSTSAPLSVKDIQAIFTRFHEQATPVLVPEPADVTPAGADASSPSAAEPATDGGDSAEPPDPSDPASASALGAEAGEALAAEPEDHDAELYAEVPSLVTATQIRETMDALAAELRAAGGVYLLIEGAQGYRIVLHPRFARWIRTLRNEPPPVKLTQSALETLAVIAYRQPVTRTEIENIRGVSAEAGLNKLLERELVYIVGRADLPGRPLQYGTTDRFLEFLGIKSLDELPASDVLSPRQVDEWLQTAMNTKAPTDADVGLPQESLVFEDASPVSAPAPAHATDAEFAVSPAEPEDAAPEETPAASGSTSDSDSAPEPEAAPASKPTLPSSTPTSDEPEPRDERV